MIMIHSSRTLIFTIITFWLTVCVVSSLIIQQSPEHLLQKVEEREAKLFCHHGDNNYPYMYWYQQKSYGGSLELIGMLRTNTHSPEEQFKTRFIISGPATSNASLVISEISTEDSAMYFCAARTNMNPAYFGNGTKLTVLDPDTAISEPQNISITTLSEKEKCKKHITLVCVVMNFYPDHLKINWEIGNKAVTAGVATDNEATKNANGKYDMSSRLKVPKEKWNKAENKFTCTYSFYNGKTYSTGSDSIHGIRGGDGYDRETHIKSAQMIKLGYGVFIAKSGLYGLIILVFVLKQGSAGK